LIFNAYRESWLSRRNRLGFFSIIHLWVGQRRGQVAYLVVGRREKRVGCNWSGPESNTFITREMEKGQ